MTTEPDKKPRQMPKGGRKGGSVFTRIILSDAIGYARKLVSKTHTGPQPQDVIMSGVVGAKSGTGQVRISALKQYGFIKGDVKTHYSADNLAKKISSAPAEELQPLLRQAVLKPVVFKKLFDTYHGDTVSKSKLKQRAADLNVHPDETSTCVDIYISGMTFAGLVTIEGDQVTHLASSDIPSSPPKDGLLELPKEDEESDDVGLEVERASGNGEISVDATHEREKNGSPALPESENPVSPRAVFNVNVTLDSSLDIEKLQKQLELLKRFGAI